MTPARFDGKQWVDVEVDREREAKYVEEAGRLLRTTLVIAVANLLLTGIAVGVVLAVAS